MPTKHEQCKATRRDGERCQGRALESGFCFAHDPSLQTTREEARKRGGKNRANVVRLRGLVLPRLLPVFDQLEAALAGVHEGSLPAGRAIAMASVARAMVAVLSAGEMEQRLREIERNVNGGSDRWEA